MNSELCRELTAEDGPLAGTVIKDVELRSQPELHESRSPVITPPTGLRPSADEAIPMPAETSWVGGHRRLVQQGQTPAEGCLVASCLLYTSDAADE